MSKETPVYYMVGTLYRESLAATGHSWMRLNGALFKLVNILIDAGVAFAEDDISRVRKDFAGEHWFGVDGPESWYAAAVDVGNLSACTAIEHYLERPRWRIDGAILCVGASIKWDGRDCKVTSLGADSVIACSYKAKATRDKIERRYTITAEDIKAAAKASRDGMTKEFGRAARVWASEGRTLADVDSMLVGTLRRAVENLGFKPTKANREALAAALRDAVRPAS